LLVIIPDSKPISAWGAIAKQLDSSRDGLAGQKKWADDDLTLETSSDGCLYRVKTRSTALPGDAEQRRPAKG
jgi:hypothetical protein